MRKTMTNTKSKKKFQPQLITKRYACMSNRSNKRITIIKFKTSGKAISD